MLRTILLPAGFLLVYCAAAQTPNGAYLFRRNCAACHFPGNTTRAPLPDVLALQPRQALLDALEKGSMKEQAAKLSAAERAAVVDYLVNPAVAPQPQAVANKCAAAPPAFSQLGGWNG